MDAEEREIFLFLKSWQHQFVSAREICRRAGGKRRFRQSPEWAKPFLGRMVERSILETDGNGHYRLKPIPKKSRQKRWVSPQIAKILQNSGKDFGEIVISDAEADSYYEKL